jgi:hypothetical protein
MDQEKHLDLILKEFQKVIQIHFPEFINPRSGYTGSNFDSQISIKNKDFVKTPFFYNGNLKFIHFTNLFNLISILNSKSIRLYNLIHSEDEEEFNYAANILGLKKEMQEYLKEYYYSFSFCDANELNNKHMWEEYGNKFKGVALEFEIVNNPINWINYHISEILYDLPKSLKDFKNDIDKLKHKYPGANFNYDINRIIGFFKKYKFRGEKEIRIATYFPFKSTSQIIRHTFPDFKINGKRNRISNYFQLPIYVNHESVLLEAESEELIRLSKFNDEFYNTEPKLKITNIHFGEKCGLDDNELIKFTQKLNQTLQYKYGYDDLNLNYNFIKESDCI